MSAFRNGQPVEVVALHGEPQSHLLPGFATRPPQVGDVGVIVRVPTLVARLLRSARYVVEGGERGAAWAWLGEFSRAELAPTSLPL